MDLALAVLPTLFELCLFPGRIMIFSLFSPHHLFLCYSGPAKVLCMASRYGGERAEHYIYIYRYASFLAEVQ